MPLEYGTASLGDLFNPANAGKVVVAPTRRWPRWAAGWTPRASCRSRGWTATRTKRTCGVWDIALAEAIKAKGNIVQWWSGENEAQAGFHTNGGVLGLCWDSTGFNLRQGRLGYIAPKEGAFAWNQGFVLMKNAANVEQAHEFAKLCRTPEGSAPVGNRLLGQPGRQGRDREARSGGCRLLQRAPSTTMR